MNSALLHRYRKLFFEAARLSAYSPSDEIVVRWNDPAIGIAWGVGGRRFSFVVAPLLAEAGMLPPYGKV